MRPSVRSAVLFLLCVLAWGLIAYRSNADDIQVADISFVDDLHGWVSVLSPEPCIFRTTDGGQSWSRISLPPQQGFYRLHFFDLKIGIAIQLESEDSTGIYRTENAGLTWIKVNTIKPRYGEIVADMTTTSDADAFVVGEGAGGRGYVAQLTDRGQTLRLREDVSENLAQQLGTLGVFGDGTGHLWIVGKNLVLHSADNGKTWENQNMNTSPELDLAFSGTALPGGHAWFVADFGIYRTEDYGKHWVKSPTTVEKDMMNFNSVSFSSIRDGCAVGNSSFIYCTNDGGNTWTGEKVFGLFPTGSPFFSKVLMLSSTNGWASVNGELYKTEDGGHTFNETLTSSATPKSDIPGETQALETPINGPTGLSFDKNGFLYIVEAMQTQLIRLDISHSSIKVMIPGSGNGPYKNFDYPNAIAADGNGSVFIADFNGRLRKLDTLTGNITVLIPVSSDQRVGVLDVPAQMTLDPRGNLLVVDRHHKLFRWRPGAVNLETVAGRGRGFGGDDGLAVDAQLTFPMGVAVNSAGDIFVADYQNCRIRKIDATTQIISTFAGTGNCASDGDGGDAREASLNYPSAMAIDHAGNLFVVEGGRVRRIDGRGMITTYAGTGQPGFSGDGGQAEIATLNNPAGLAVDPDGNLYISEFVNNRIRRVDAVTHIITTVAGNGKPSRVDSVM